MSKARTEVPQAWNKDVEYAIEDVEYLRHGRHALFARLYRPHGPGPFRMVAELHGGVWSKFVAAYRAAGGSLDVALYDAPQYFTVHEPGSPDSLDAFARMIGFFRAHIPEP
jgi:hypothetical protein